MPERGNPQLRPLQTQFRQFHRQVNDVFLRDVRQAILAGAQESDRVVPVRTGRLKRSRYINQFGWGYTAPYANYVEFNYNRLYMSRGFDEAIRFLLRRGYSADILRRPSSGSQN